MVARVGLILVSSLSHLIRSASCSTARSSLLMLLILPAGNRLLDAVQGRLLSALVVFVYCPLLLAMPDGRTLERLREDGARMLPARPSEVRCISARVAGLMDR